jgi:Loader and inhibitor of phage G40P
VKRDEAMALLRMLRAAYPTTKVEADTSELWLSELRRLDATIGEQAVRSVIASSRFWPSLAELHEQVEAARRQAAQARRDEERQQADGMAEELPRPPLEEIPEVQALLDRWSESFGLPSADPGACDECGEEAKTRFVLGRFTLCRDCTRRRKGVSVGVHGPRHPRDPIAARRSSDRSEKARQRDARRRERMPTSCRLCKKELRAHERPEGECDECLKTRSAPTFPVDEAGRSTGREEEQ